MGAGGWDNRAISSVIGIILVVAVTVILATTIATVTLTLTDKSSNDPEVAAFGVEKLGDFEDENEPGTIEFTMREGEPIPASDLTVKINGDPASQTSATVSLPANKVEAGDTILVEQSDLRVPAPPDRITLIKESEGQSTFLAETELSGQAISTLSKKFTFVGYSVGQEPGEPWSINTGGALDFLAEGTVSDSKAVIGDRSLYLKAGYRPGNTGGSSNVKASVDVDLTEVEKLSFQYTGERELELRIDGSTVLDPPAATNWQQETVDVSGYSGVHTVTFYMTEIDGGRSSSNSNAFVDDVRFLGSDDDVLSDDEVLP